MISQRASKIAFSSTVKINQKARELRAAGVDVLDLSVGEPDFHTPEFIKHAAKKAIDNNCTKYTAVAGLPEMRKSIVAHFSEIYGVDYKTDEVMVSNGVKHALFNFFMAAIDPGDEVIIPAPYWVSYPEQVKMAEGKSVFVQTTPENDFLLQPDDLEKAITSKTKALVICNPSNPTGTMYTPQQLEQLGRICVEHKIIIVADEIYSRLVYGEDNFKSVAALGEEIKKQTMIFNGVSKSYAMTGWRIGFALGNSEVIAAMTKIQSHNSSNASTVSQMAAKAALEGSSAELLAMRGHFEERGKFVAKRLNGINGIKCIEPHGGFSLFPNIESYYGKQLNGTVIRGSVDFAEFLLEKARVAVVPGEAFGKDGFVRISFATSKEILETAMDRFEQAVS